MASFKRYIFFNPNDTHYEEVTQFITLTGRDTYTGTQVVDVFHAADNTLIVEGCTANIEAARFQ